MASENEPFSTGIWVSRIQGLKSHLRLIQREGEGSSSSHVRRIVRQAEAGIEEADRYLAEPDWGSQT